MQDFHSSVLQSVQDFVKEVKSHQTMDPPIPTPAPLGQLSSPTSDCPDCTGQWNSRVAHPIWDLGSPVRLTGAVACQQLNFPGLRPLLCPKGLIYPRIQSRFRSRTRASRDCTGWNLLPLPHLIEAAIGADHARVLPLLVGRALCHPMMTIDVTIGDLFVSFVGEIEQCYSIPMEVQKDTGQKYMSYRSPSPNRSFKFTPGSSSRGTCISRQPGIVAFREWCDDRLMDVDGTWPVMSLDWSFPIPLETCQFCKISLQCSLPGMPCGTLHYSLFRTWIYRAGVFYNARILCSLLWILVHRTYSNLGHQLSQTNRWCWYLSTLGLMQTSRTNFLQHS